MKKDDQRIGGPKQCDEGEIGEENKANQIAVIALGSFLILYLNKQKVDTITDTSYTSGFIGLRVSAYGKQVEGVYTNAKLWLL